MITFSIRHRDLINLKKLNISLSKRNSFKITLNSRLSSEHFENLLQSAFTIANKSARHGGKEIPSLVGSLIVFIVERYITQAKKIIREIKGEPIPEYNHLDKI